MVEEAKQQQRISKAYSEKYLGMAVISELSLLTPANIRLIDLKANLGSAAPEEELLKKDKKEAVKSEVKNLTLEGLVFGDRGALESSLGGFIMKLKESPMFGQISIQKNSIEPFRKNDVLHFIIEIKLAVS